MLLLKQDKAYLTSAQIFVEKNLQTVGWFFLIIIYSSYVVLIWLNNRGNIYKCNCGFVGNIYLNFKNKDNFVLAWAWISAISNCIFLARLPLKCWMLFYVIIDPNSYEMCIHGINNDVFHLKSKQKLCQGFWLPFVSRKNKALMSSCFKIKHSFALFASSNTWKLIKDEMSGNETSSDNKRSKRKKNWVINDWSWF